MKTKNASVEIQSATQYYVRHDKFSYGIFCISEIGDLFLNSDYGFYGYAWRSFGAGKFKSFLATCDADYIFMKLEGNHKYLFSKNLPKHVHDPVKALFNELKEALRIELAMEQTKEIV